MPNSVTISAEAAALCSTHPPLVTLNESVLEGLLDLFPQYVYVVDEESFQITYLNKRAREHPLRGIKQGDICYHAMRGNDAPCEMCPLVLHRTYPQCSMQTLELFTQQEKTWETVSTFFFLRPNNKRGYILFISSDFTDHQAIKEKHFLNISNAEGKLEKQEDEVTGIANRHCYKRLGFALFNKCVAEHCGVAIIVFKINGLRYINSIHGYAFGDSVLRFIAKTISKIVCSSSIFARLNGNDFVLLHPLHSGDSISEIKNLTDKLKHAAYTALHPLARNRISFHFGISVYPEHGDSFEKLNLYAHQAVSLRAKTDATSCSFYDNTLIAQIHKRDALKHDILESIERNELELHYQPKYDVHQRCIVGVEALLRWNHAVHGKVSPDMFIPLAEQSSFILTIDDWVMRESCRRWKALQQAGCHMLSTSFNLSPQKFYHTKLIDELHALADEYSVPLSMLEVELTERTALQDISRATSIMQSLRESGVKVALDDFGTGYSSLNYLRVLPVDVVKLDRSFIVDPNPHTLQTLQAIVALIKIYGAQLVFEGIETTEQYSLALQAKCDIVQGYYIGVPMPYEQLLETMKNERSAFKAS